MNVGDKFTKIKKNEDILSNLDNILSNNINKYCNNSLSISYMIYYLIYLFIILSNSISLIFLPYNFYHN